MKSVRLMLKLIDDSLFELLLLGLYTHIVRVHFRSSCPGDGLSEKTYEKFSKTHSKRHTLESLFYLVIKVQVVELWLYWKETPAQASSCVFCEIFKKTYFTEHLRWQFLDITYDTFKFAEVIKVLYLNNKNTWFKLYQRQDPHSKPSQTFQRSFFRK